MSVFSISGAISAHESARASDFHESRGIVLEWEAAHDRCLPIVQRNELAERITRHVRQSVAAAEERVAEWEQKYARTLARLAEFDTDVAPCRSCGQIIDRLYEPDDVWVDDVGLFCDAACAEAGVQS